jgi:hypothetical protein
MEDMGYKFHTSVQSDMRQDSVLREYMKQEKSSEIRRGNCIVSWDKYSLLG